MLKPFSSLISIPVSSQMQHHPGQGSVQASQRTIARTASAVSCAAAAPPRLAPQLPLKAHQRYRSMPIVATVKGSCQLERLPPATRLGALMMCTRSEAARCEA